MICECGKAIRSKFQASRGRCRSCDVKRMDIIKEINANIAMAGKCPICGQELRRNLSLTGWWQCVGFGAEGFRSAGSTQCSFQMFI